MKLHLYVINIKLYFENNSGMVLDHSLLNLVAIFIFNIYHMTFHPQNK